MSVVINGGVGVTFPDSVTQTSGVPSPGTSGNVLTSNGTIWVSQAAAAFDSGTAMIFKQTAAPTGWTKSTALNDYALRVVSGTASTGGSVGFTTAFASQTPAGSVSINTSGLSAGATTLSTSQIPSHTHGVSGGDGYADGGGLIVISASANNRSSSTGSAGSGGSHTHSVSGSATGTFTGTAINLAVNYADVIIATKN